jgi:hypothetical protein
MPGPTRGPAIRTVCGFVAWIGGGTGSPGEFRSTDEERRAVPNPSIKDEKTYREVRKSGASKEKAARVANAAAKEGRSTVSRRGGKSSRYEDMSKADLYERAKKVGIAGRSNMNKEQLVKALRNH